MKGVAIAAERLQQTNLIKTTDPNVP